MNNDNNNQQPQQLRCDSQNAAYTRAVLKLNEYTAQQRALVIFLLEAELGRIPKTFDLATTVGLAEFSMISSNLASTNQFLFLSLLNQTMPELLAMRNEKLKAFASAIEYGKYII